MEIPKRLFSETITACEFALLSLISLRSSYMQEESPKEGIWELQLT